MLFVVIAVWNLGWILSFFHSCYYKRFVHKPVEFRKLGPYHIYAAKWTESIRHFQFGLCQDHRLGRSDYWYANELSCMLQCITVSNWLVSIRSRLQVHFSCSCLPSYSSLYTLLDCDGWLEVSFSSKFIFLTSTSGWRALALLFTDRSICK